MNQVRPILRPPTDPDAIRQIGRYQLQGEVARGGVGIVLRAHDVEIGRDVAIKLLRDRYRDDPALVERFVEEAQIGGQLEHPGIVPVYDVGEHDGEPYFTMKLVQGRTLAQVLRKRTSPAAELGRYLGIFERVCQTIAYAHARGVIHRDLKPSNIMVGTYGEVQVMDWGMGKVLDRQEEPLVTTVRSRPRSDAATHDSRSVVGSVMGTPAYMPPEQARGEVDRMDERSDVFALGAILVEILTGEPPFVGDEAAVFEQARNGAVEAALVRVRDRAADPELTALVERCLQPDPADRLPDASSVAGAVSDYLTATDTRARRATIAAAQAGVREEVARRSQRLFVALAVAVLLLLVGGVGAWVWSDRVAVAERTRVHEELQAVMLRASTAHARARLVAAPEAAVFAEALGAAGEIERRLADPRIDPKLAARARTIQKTIIADAAAARDAAERRHEDAAMLERLAAARLPGEHSIRDHAFVVRDAQRRDRDYAAAFAAYTGTVGFSGADITSRLAARDIRIELAAALGHWAGALRRIGGREAEVRERLEVAIALDPDPARRRLRRLRLQPATMRQGILAFAREIDAEKLPAVTLTLLAETLFGLGEPAAARDLLRVGDRLYPRDFELHLLSGLVHEQSSPPDWHEAARMYSMARTLRPDDVRVLYRLGMALLRTGRRSEAADALRAACQRAATRGHLWASLCEVERRRNRFDDAIRAGRRAVECVPRSAFAHTNLASALCSARRLDEALSMAKQAVALDRNYATAHRILASVHCTRGEPDAALVAARAALALRPDDLHAQLSLGRALCAKQRYTEGITALQGILKAQPTRFHARYYLAIAFSNVGSKKLAEAEARRLLRLYPKDQRAKRLLAQVLSARD